MRYILYVVLLTFAVTQPATAQKPPRRDDDPRVNRTVKLVRRTLPAIVSIRVIRPTQQKGVISFGHGGGSVIHPDGYILTNNHVVEGAQRVEVAFFQGPWQAVKIVAQSPQDDLALLKLDAKEPLPALTLGRSDDLELGEPVITFGSPGGLPHSLSTGLISGLGRATDTEHAHLPSMVQTSAPISGGSSGGPLINARGEQIGMITSRKADGENLGFAITVDRVREVFPQLIAAEQRYGIVHGMQVDTLADKATVAAVATESPAEKAGVQAGDVLLHVGGKPIRNGVEFYLALVDRQAGEELPLRVRRGEEELDCIVKLQEADAPQLVEIESTEPGLKVARYEGQWNALPDFAQLQPQSTEIKSAPPWIAQDAASDHFGVTLTGLLKIPADGLYTFSTTSDDGSRLWLSGQRIVDNDGLHGEQTVSGLVRLKAGLYPLRVEYFEAAGDQALAISVAGPDGMRRDLPADWLFHSP